MTQQFEWSHTGRETLKLSLEIEDQSITSVALQATGCLAFLRLSQKMKSSLQGPIAELKAPQSTDHGAIIWREIIERIQGEWQSPVPQEELCHCRRVSTQDVDRAIVYGAHTLSEVRKRTSANTGCGTCKEDVSSLISHRLKTS